MKKQFVALGSVLFGLAIMGLFACDSSSNGGGGTESTAAGYTQSMLTGTWHYRVLRESGTTASGEIKFDATGRMIKWRYSGNHKIPPKIAGNFTVYPDGRVEARTVQIRIIDDGKIKDVIKRHWVLTFRSDGSVAGHYDFLSNTIVIATGAPNDSSGYIRYWVWFTPKSGQ